MIDAGEAMEASADGETRQVAQLAPGQFFGEMSLLTDDPHSARVRAKTSVRCLALSRRDFTALLDDEPKVAVAMLPVLARRLRDSI